MLILKTDAKGMRLKIKECHHISGLFIYISIAGISAQ